MPDLIETAPAVCLMTQHMDPGSCSFSSLPRATNPRPSSNVSSPLCPLIAGAQHKWLQMKFYVLALWVALCISSHLSLADRNPAAFHSWVLSGFLSGSGAIGWGAWLQFRPHTSQGDPPSHWNSPLVLQLPPMGAQPAPLHLPHTSYQGHCSAVVSSVCLWLLGFSPVSVQLVDDFSAI